LQDVEGGERSPDSSEISGFADATLRQPENDRKQHDHPEEKDHPRSVLSLAESAEETQGVSGGSEGKKRGRRPTQEHRYRVRKQGSGPAEVSFYVTVALEARPAFRGESAGEKEREEKEDDAANLARKRRLRRPIVPVPARAW
jgi:hypothetical protein